MKVRRIVDFNLDWHRLLDVIRGRVRFRILSKVWEAIVRIVVGVGHVEAGNKTQRKKKQNNEKWSRVGRAEISCGTFHRFNPL